MAASAEEHIHRVWQEQPQKEQTMSIDEIRSRARRFEARVRRGNVIAATLFVLIVIAEAWQVWIQRDILERTGDLLTIAALVYVAFRFRGHTSVESMPAGLGLTTGVDFYRAQLARQRDLSRDSWGFLLPFVPGVSLALLGRSVEQRPTGQVVALAAFGVALFLGVAWVNARSARKLQKEIDALVS